MSKDNKTSSKVKAGVIAASTLGSMGAQASVGPTLEEVVLASGMHFQRSMISPSEAAESPTLEEVILASGLHQQSGSGRPLELKAPAAEVKAPAVAVDPAKPSDSKMLKGKAVDEESAVPKELKTQELKTPRK